ETMAREQRSANEVLCYTTGEMSAAVDTTAGSIYNVSDAFATDKRLIDLVDRDYTGKQLEKQRNRNFILGSLFESYNRLQPQERMDALYVTTRKELFNFIDPNQNEDIVLQNFARLRMNEKKKLSKFFWYPLQDNFLKTTPYGMPRRDTVIFGSRRVYSPTKSGYPYLHVFAVEEETLYEQYRLLAEKIGAEVYLLDADNALLSSSNLAAVESRTVPESLQHVLDKIGETVTTQTQNEQSYNVCAVRSELTGWLTVAAVPSAAITQTTRSLYLKILCVVAICFAACGLMLVYVYRRFMEPLVQMEASIAQVDSGNLKAYVQPQGQAEMVQMMRRYNTMLDSIRRDLAEKVQMETNKKDLEMQVLMNQINPHFLYNTLETIVWRAGDAGRPDIGKIAASLGKLYRLSISGG
ncbi:MAG: histidine kinase, partial [Ruthenibacterium sp.]